MPDPDPVSLAPTPIKSVTLQTDDGIAITSNSDGVVRTWDVSTGICRETSRTPAKNPSWSDAWLINSRLISIWLEDKKIHTWGVGDVKPQTPNTTLWDIDDFRLSGDGSKVFFLRWEILQAWSILTGEVVGEVNLEISSHQRSLSVDSSRVWVYSPVLETLELDFGIQGSPVQLLNSVIHHPNNTKVWDIGKSKLKDAATGKVVFQLGGRFASPVSSQWDGQYLISGYSSGEVLILDFNHVHF